MNFLMSYDIKHILIILIIIFYLIARLTILYRDYIYPKYNLPHIKKLSLTVEENKHFVKNFDIITFVKYLDQYYVKNIYFTIVCIILYFIGYTLPFIYLRYKAFNENSLNNFPYFEENLNITLYTITNLVIYIILFIITIIVYKVCLDILFYKEILKLHIYLCENKIYNAIKRHFDETYSNNIIDKYYLFVYNITKLRPVSNLTYDEQESRLFDVHKYIYEDKDIYNWGHYWCNLAKKYKLVLWIFHILRFILKIIYIYFVKSGMDKNQPNFGHYIPSLIYFIAIFYDFIHLKIYYSFYLVIPFMLSLLYFKISKFYDSIGSLVDLYSYFYKNSFDYKIQRELLYENIEHFMLNINKSEQNKELFNVQYLRRLAIKVLHNLEDPDDYFTNLENQEVRRIIQNEKHLKYMYIRAYILSLNIIIILYLILNRNIYINFWDITNISFLFIIIPVFFITIICHLYTFKKPKYISNDDGSSLNYLEYKFSALFNKLFWILIIIQISIYWIVIIKAILFISFDGILWQGYGIQLVKLYTLDEKIIYLYQYFDYYTSCINNGLLTLDIDYLRHIIRQIDYTLLLTENVTLKDIQVYIKILVDNNFLLNLWDSQIKQNLLLYTENTNGLYAFIRNSIGLLSVVSSFVYTIQFLDTWYNIVYNLSHTLYKVATFFFNRK